ncbi:MAG TPA: NAD(P)/FAD-dependent oxidoreductase [Solirubrobacteraceae bacterium]|jgi:monoamine oxidase|nr:NAD(P)/FAD-dependent oxidoreductase [Solirubrobacteraceae bacterium]
MRSQTRGATARWAQRMFALHCDAARSGLPVEEIEGARGRGRSGLTRREVLAAGAGLAASSALASPPARALARLARSGGGPRLAVVGAGLAGLRCAHLLWTGAPGQPLAATVYEANPDRAGGRCWTLRGFFSGGLETEHGGSFLNSNQLAVRSLAAELGIAEEVVNGGDLESGEEVFFIGGARYSLAEAQADWRDFGFDAFRAAAREMRQPGGEARLDAMSVPDWLDSTPIGAHSRFGRLMQANTVTENGGDPSDQSALDLIELLTGNPRSSLVPLPGDDERYHLVGGNDQLVSRMIAALPGGAVQQGYALVAVRERSDRSLALSFESAGSIEEVVADWVVLALPFSTLREVDLSRSGLSAAKLAVIRTMGMGTNAKVHLELTHKTWPALGYSGAIYGEWQRLACGWDDCVQLGPGASPALYLAFPGARAGASGLTGAAHGPAPAADVATALGDIEHLFAGTTAAFTGRAYEDHWSEDPWVHGAYSYYRVGQASSYGTIARRTEGRMLFAGEHTSIANIGFLDGAVETGERAARRLLHRFAR